MCIGQESTRTSNVSSKHVKHANASDLDNHKHCSSQHHPTQPWQHLGTDLFEFDQHEYLVIAEYYSHMPIIWKVPHRQCNSSKVISLLKQIFSKHGSPETLVSDNGPQYASTAFAEFADESQFTHLTSSLNHPKGNGFAESMVKIVKQILQNGKFSGCDPHLALLSYRCTPLDS